MVWYPDVLTSDGHLPHSGEQLDESSVGVGKSDNDGGDGNIMSLSVDQGKNEGGEGESAETERSRVGEFAEALLVGSGLESSSESGHHNGLLAVKGGSIEGGGGSIVVLGSGGNTRLEVGALLGVVGRRHLDY